MPEELPHIELLDPQMIAILRTKTPAERWEMAAGSGVLRATASAE